MKKMIRVMLIGLSCLMLLQACADKEVPKEEVTLKLWSSQSDYERVAVAIGEAYPHLRLERVQPYREILGPRAEINDWEAYYENVGKALDSSQPDLMMLDAGEQHWAAKQGKLYSLEGLLQDEAFRQDGYPEALIQLLRLNGNGELFGLADSFYTNAIFYNKTLFEQHQIPLPTSGMKWSEVLQSAKLFAGTNAEQHIFGYFAGTNDTPRAWHFIREIAMAANLKTVQMDQNLVALDSQRWKEIWGMVLEAYQAGAVFDKVQARITDESGDTRYYDTYKPEDFHGPFLAGQAAMYKSSLDFIEYLSANEVPFEWGIVSEPVDDQTGLGMSMGPAGTYSVNANTAHADEAMAVIKHMTSEEYLKTNSQLGSFGVLPARNSGSIETLVDVSDLYLVPQVEYGQYYEYNFSGMPAAFAIQLDQLANETFDRLLAGEQNLEPALEQLQNEAQAAWNTLER